MIFYFSATGNSRYVAQRLAEATGDRLISLPEAIRAREYQYALGREERVGFVAPTYFYGLPSVLRFFVEKLQLTGYEEQYVYVVLTCGGTTGDAAGMLAKMLRKKGITLSAQFAVPMVDNYIPMSRLDSEEKREKCLDAAEEYIDEARRAVRSRGFGDYNRCQGAAPAALTAAAYPLYERRRPTRVFVVTDACTGCGLCRELCPCEAISLEAGKPVWSKPQCVHCLGCLHRCPSGAIHWKKADEARGRYYNPRVKAKLP